MKGRMVVGALLLSVALVGQGFGFELLNGLMGVNRGCSTCGEPACANACEPACPAPCCEACEPACCEPACEPCCAPRCDLFAGLKGLFACKSCGCAASPPASVLRARRLCPEPAAASPPVPRPVSRPVRPPVPRPVSPLAANRLVSPPASLAAAKRAAPRCWTS